jgi:hypothetical protein
MGSGAVRVYHHLRIPVNGSESRKKRDELIYFIVRVSFSFVFNWGLSYDISIKDAIHLIIANPFILRSVQMPLSSTIQPNNSPILNPIYLLVTFTKLPIEGQVLELHSKL